MNVVLSAVSACTPVGLHAEATCAALRAGLANLMELSTHSVGGEQFPAEPMVGGRVPTEWKDGEPKQQEWLGFKRFGLPPPPPRTSGVRPGVERVIELCRLALGEIRERADLDAVGAGRYKIYVGLGETEPAGLVLEELRAELGGEPEHYVAETSGRAAGLSLLDQALADLRERRVEGALVGGVDSLIRAPIAERLDAARRIRCKLAPEGLSPGEAAAFVYLEPGGQAARRRRTALATLSAVATAFEPSTGTEEPNLGLGLSQALRAVRREAGLEAMPLVVCDLNGERPRAIEWGLASARALGDLHGKSTIWHPADCVGDTGAAAGILDLVWAATALRRGYAPSNRALVWGASDGALRGAAVLVRSA